MRKASIYLMAPEQYNCVHNVELGVKDQSDLLRVNAITERLVVEVPAVEELIAVTYLDVVCPDSVFVRISVVHLLLWHHC